MKYTVKEIIALSQTKQHLKYIFFWGHTEKGDEVTKACLSQWYPCQFTVDGVVYHTAEQYMMARKALLFRDEVIYRKIMEAKHPKQYKELGREIKGFVESVWEEHKYKIVVDGNYEKFSQNQDLRNFLLGTNSRILVEASPYDKIWGIGLAADDSNIENPLMWQGENLLGFALMEVRDMLAN